MCQNLKKYQLVTEKNIADIVVICLNTREDIKSFIALGLTEVAFAWYDIHGRDKTDDEIQEQWCSENIKR